MSGFLKPFLISCISIVIMGVAERMVLAESTQELPPGSSYFDRPEPVFDGQTYLCSSGNSRLKTFADVNAFSDYLNGLTTGGQELDTSNCGGSYFHMMHTVSKIDGARGRISSAAAYVSFFVSRSVEAKSFEARYANDSEMLLHMTLVCRMIGLPRESCFRAIVATLHEEFFASSPVFCDYASDSTVLDIPKITEREEKVVDELLFTCGAVSGRTKNVNGWFDALDSLIHRGSL